MSRKEEIEILRVKINETLDKIAVGMNFPSDFVQESKSKNNAQTRLLTIIGDLQDKLQEAEKVIKFYADDCLGESARNYFKENK